jgi:hypothetical protein
VGDAFGHGESRIESARQARNLADSKNSLTAQDFQVGDPLPAKAPHAYAAHGRGMAKVER